MPLFVHREELCSPLINVEFEMNLGRNLDRLIQNHEGTKAVLTY
jgi:hypothetical protein